MLKLRTAPRFTGIFDEVIVQDRPDRECLLVKIQFADISPYERAVVLDADTKVLMRIDEAAMTLLDHFDLCAPLRCTPATTRYSLDGLLDQTWFSHWHTGMFLFKKNERTLKLSKDWMRIHLTENWKPDQPSFAKAVYENPALRMLSLDVSWNYAPKYRVLGKYMEELIKIDHYVDVLNNPSVATTLLELNREVLQHDPPEVASKVGLPPETIRRFKLIGSRLINNSAIPPLRAGYNAFKQRFGIKRRLPFVHKRRAWKF